MKKYFITIFVVLASFAAVSAARAEAPCTYIGQDSLEAVRACVGAARQVQYQDVHHGQIMSAMANDEQIPPHPYIPYGDDEFYRTMSLAAMMGWGYKYHHPGIYPFAVYYYTAPYFYGGR